MTTYTLRTDLCSSSALETQFRSLLTSLVLDPTKSVAQAIRNSPVVLDICLPLFGLDASDLALELLDTLSPADKIDGYHVLFGVYPLLKSAARRSRVCPDVRP